VPGSSKNRALLGLEATTTLDQMLDEVLPWVTSELELAAAEAPVGTPDLAR
jgi:nucleoside-diphosphate-sugar epimerase